MSDQLLIDIDNLYRLYDYRNIKVYHQFTFFPKYKSIDIDVFYDIINSLSIKELSNIDTFIYKQITLTNKLLHKTKPIRRYNTIVSRKYSHINITSKHEFDNKLNNYIQGDTIIGLFIMNQFIKFLYPS
mgnify:FL=1